MEIIAITDIHGRKNYGKTTLEAIANADLVLIAGDITNFNDGQEAGVILDNIQKLNNKILAVHGNDDERIVNQTLDEKGFNLHCKTQKINNITIYGIGGSRMTPFNTPQEYSESEIKEILDNFKLKVDTGFHVLLSHSPPSLTKLDRTFSGQLVGSQSIRNFIENAQPDLVICGHIHEARGVDKIGKTILINPGPFPKYYVKINITDQILYKLY